MTQADPAQRNDAARPRRHWFQYSLRTLLIFTAVVAVWLAWWSHKARQQRDAVAALKKSGWIPGYSFTVPGTQWMKAKAIQWPTWFVKFVGVHYCANVEMLTYEGNAKIVTDKDIAQIRTLSDVTWILVPKRSMMHSQLKQEFPECSITKW